MANSLSNLTDNLAEGLHEGKCKDWKFCPEYANVVDNLVVFNCLECNKNYPRESDKNLKKQLANAYRFCKGDINKSILMLQKGLYPYEYIHG